MLIRRSTATGRPGGPLLPFDPAAAKAGGVFWPLWLASVLLPLLAFAVGAWWSWRTVEAETRTRLLRAAEVQGEHARRIFETQEAILAAIQARTRGMGWPGIRQSAELHAFLRRIDGSTPGTSGIGLVSPEGSLVQLSGGPFPPPALDLSGRDYVQAQRGRDPAEPAFVGATMHSGVTQRVLFALSRPTLDEAGRPDGGTAWATLRPVDIEAFYAALVDGPRDSAMLLRADGTILAHHPPLEPLVGRRLPEGSPKLAMAARALATGEPAISPAPSLADGVTRLHAVRRVEGYPVVVVHGLHEAAPRRVWLRHVVAIGGVSGALSLALLWLTWRVQRQARREAAALARERDALQAARMEAERRADAEAALREGQRLEALGQLAAGVAHDFRNVVQAVQGGARLIGEAATRDPGRVQALAGMVAEAAGRGAELTNRMLDFARGRVGPGEAGTDPAGAVEAAYTLLRATLGSRHRLACRIADGLPARVRGGRAELEAALMNLAINARDAMPAGGTVSVAAEAERNPPGLARGAYARITVSDTGEGMDEATLRRATEAFFTTKPRGKGTGLGLATVRAFAEGAGGGLAIASTPGEGTAVTLRLPAA